MAQGIERNCEVDDLRWPIVKITFDGLQTGEDIEAFIYSMERLGDSDERFGIITHIKRYRPELKHVKRLGSWLMGIEDFGDICVAIALVIPHDRFRFMLSSFFSMATIPRPYIVTGDPVEAENWLVEQMAKAGIRVPPSDEI